MIGIYKITNPSGKIYIGQSINIDRRFKSYRKLQNCKSQPKLFNSFCKYGVENHKFEIICECEAKELNDKERYYQDLYNSSNKNLGLNCFLTKSSDRSGTHNEETKKKLSISNTGKKPTKETLSKMSKSMIGKNLGSKNGMFGKKTSEKVKKLQREKLSGQLNYLSKIILNTETGVFYYGLREASNSCHLSKSVIHINITKNKKNKTNFIYV